MFDNLTDRLSHSLRNITGSGRLTEDNIKDTLREVRMALLEADVALPVVKEFVDRIREQALGQEVMQALAVPQLILLGVAKGVTRKPGLETLYLNDAAHEFTLPGDSPALHLIQQVRDEAHRFAITGHRARRGKARRTSSLEDVAGVGPKRRRELLKHFGGLHELIRASSDEIAKAPGISKKLAELIYATLHSE